MLPDCAQELGTLFAGGDTSRHGHFQRLIAHSEQVEGQAGAGAKDTCEHTSPHLYVSTHGHCPFDSTGSHTLQKLSQPGSHLLCTSQ